MLFQNAYTPMAKCAPSRAIVLTGRHLWQNEEAGNHLAVFPPKLKSWPEVLTEKGWHVGITGKGWGPGIANDANGKPRLITGKPFNQRKAEPPTTAMGNNDYAANFADFLDAAPKDAPWCFWYGAHEPHRGYEFQSGVNKGGKKLTDIDRVPAYWPDNETVRHDMLDYAFEVEHVDHHLGRMIAELEKRGLLDNTLIIVTSDHGMPFPRVKGYAYHDSNHVPLAVRWPRGMRNPGRVIEDFVDFTDIAPTILDYAGIAWEDSGMMPITGQELAADSGEHEGRARRARARPRAHRQGAHRRGPPAQLGLSHPRHRHRGLPLPAQLRADPLARRQSRDRLPRHRRQPDEVAHPGTRPRRSDRSLLAAQLRHAPRRRAL